MPRRRAPRRGALLGILVVGCATVTGAIAALAISSSPASVTAAATPGEIAYGSVAAVSGVVSAGGSPVSGALLGVEASPYPYEKWSPVATGASGAGGGYEIALGSPQRNERVRVLDTSAGGTASPTILIAVDPRAQLTAHDLGPGRVRLSASITHAPGLRSPSVTARWYTAARGSDVYHLAATGTTRERGGAVTYASAIIDPPSPRFAWRVCVNPAWEAAMGPPAGHGSCPVGGFRLPAAAARATGGRPRARAAFEFGGEASGTPVPAVPTAAGIAAARSWLEGRAGRTSFAVVDSTGRLWGLDLREHFETASVVKVMFLTSRLSL